MPAPLPLTSPLRAWVQRVQDWPVASQQRARRNAMIAATACAQRRVERQDVANFLSALAPAGDTGPVEGPADHLGNAPATRVSRR
ncbi:hypothetical protein [Nocardioides rubriscoriae]|uniref:hypothetical protein n=1 Tax=Nocardioides rubriscoriae TaxID=642762 RepID=UPI0011E034E6|nr:hypothetical protein [Nocardioides rubriscoriae]